MAKRKIAIITSISILGALLALVTGYWLYFSFGQRALPGVQIGQVSVAGKTAAEIEATLNSVVAKEKIKFQGENLDGKTTKLADLGIKIDAAKLATAALAPNTKFRNYFTIPFTGKQIDAKLAVDAAQLSHYAMQLSSEVTGAKAAVEPQIIAEETGFKVEPGAAGRGIAPEILTKAAQELIDTQKSVTVKVKLSEITPRFTVAQLTETKTAAEKYLAPEIAVTVGEKTIPVELKTKISWLTFPKNKVTVNEAAINDWLTQIATPLNKDAELGKRNVDHAGNVLEIVTKAKPAEKVTNFAAALRELQTYFTEQTSATVALNVEVSEPQWEDRRVAPGAEHLAYKAAEGEKWIEINLTTNKMTAYEGGTRVRGPITVTTGAAESKTVTGKYKVWHKTAVQDMRGTRADGSQYHLKNVPSNLFFHGDYAIHGTPWWGPDEWGMRASNGCVNTPVAEAKWLFNWAPLGTVVVSYY